ncbi:manganese catalase family protein [Peribacillus simplex]|uniref:manganese catalase family protein n=1 Tax=Peribacillus simplex TaxID=1478 RepID=UPI0021A9B52E|nr:manganese catalase family protein [Peribacillus simplex]
MNLSNQPSTSCGAGGNMPEIPLSNGAPLDEVIKGGANPITSSSVRKHPARRCCGNPWNGSWVYDHGNLVANLLNNVMLESTGVLQKSRIYEMSSNKSMRETLAFLMVRDNAHQNAFTKALETLGVDWGKIFPVPNYDLNKYPECRKYVDLGYHNAQFNFRLDQTQIGEIFKGETPSRNGGNLAVTDPPKGFPVPEMPDMPNEHNPGLSDLNN